MKLLIWKEWRENVKWAALPTFLILGPMLLFGVPMLMDDTYLSYVSLVAGSFGALFGISAGVFRVPGRQAHCAFAPSPEPFEDLPG
jgi:hypothetical protein